MNKFLHFAVLYVIIGLTFANPLHEIAALFRSDHHSEANTITKFCSNTTKAQLYLAQTVALVNKLQANSTYNTVLQSQWKNFVAYLKNTNPAFVSTNCTTFATNLNAAKSADIAAENKQEEIDSYIEHQFEAVQHNTTGNKEEPIEFESHNEKKHRH